MDTELVVFGFAGTTVAGEEPVREVLGASRAFAQLRQLGVLIAVVTDRSIASTDAALEQLGWRGRELVDVCITGDDVERGAPYPDAIYEAMARAGVRESARVAAVAGDVSGLQQASAAGCGLVVGVFDEAGSFERVRRAPHNVLLPTCALVPELLRRVHARRLAPLALRRSDGASL